MEHAQRDFGEEWLRGRFAASRVVTPFLTGDGRLLRDDQVLRSAAVLVPVICRGGDLSVLFTRRTDHLYDHAGQISFPGGRTEPHEATAEQTALRETAEEIGLPADRVEILGCLGEYVTVTGYRVTPVVGLVRAPLALTPDKFEVAEIFEVPLGIVLDPSNHQRNSVVQLGRQRHYYALPYGQYYIWGATAGMLMNFYSFLTS